MLIGVDMGGTKIEAAALDEAGAVIGRCRVATPAGDYGQTVREIAALVESVEREAGSTGSVGVGIPGAVSRTTGLVKHANSVCLIGHPLERDLAEALGRPVRLANDADCFALSEATDGAAAGARSVFGVILGTGVGGGIVVHGRLVVGANWIAGEWGHNPLPWPLDHERPGPPCYCGKTGCIETFVSGPGLARDHGGDASPATIVERAAAGDSAAEAALSRYEDRLARALATVINFLDPEVIVLGGGMSKVERLYSGVPARWGRYVFSDSVVTRLVPPKHGDSSGVRGAAWLWLPPGSP